MGQSNRLTIESRVKTCRPGTYDARIDYKIIFRPLSGPITNSTRICGSGRGGDLLRVCPRPDLGDRTIEPRDSSTPRTIKRAMYVTYLSIRKGISDESQ